MKRIRYSDGSNVNAGFPDMENAVYLAADTASDAFTAETLLRIKPETGDVWVAIGTAPTATAQTDGNELFYFGIPEDIAIEIGDKIIATGPISVTPYK